MTAIENAECLTRSPEEAMPILGVGRTAIYQLVRSKRLRSIRVGRKILIPLSAIHDFLNDPSRDNE